MDSGQANCKVHDCSENDRRQNTGRYLRYDLSKEVGAHRVHIVVHFSQEHRPLIWEYQNDVLDRIERDGHGDEEKSSIPILNTLDCSINVRKQHDSEDSCHYCH